ncbi:outer membrane protein assembly factor [uncultured Mitsuokella sp.]|uniref:BamA/OMP85 family outer membrane protein n=1 Tax=uncultured Mitsuokella sp. TaxID=453120 RepID=UPI00266F7644|nr:outer membrane protein assembly factor [uncultured Mitsuokella sp.]
MKKQKYRSLAYAVALAVSCAAVPGTSFAAEAQPAEAANTAAANTAAAEDTAAAAKAVTQETAKTETAVKAADTSAAAQADAAANSSIDERTQNWAKTRPEETAIADGMKQYEGQTVVDTIFDGTSKATEGTAKAAISMKAGDMFTVKGLDADREKIYNTGYFYDIYPTFEKVPEGVIITYHVLENPVLKGVNITGNTVESSDTLNSFVTLKTGEILNSRELNKAVTAIQEQYRRDGYILAKITDMNIDKNGILNLKVNEGILEGYKVKGNTKTKERVILREMRQKPGEPFNSKLARRSMQRVYNLGFFEDVNIKMNPGVDPNAVVMELDVTEKRTGSFGIGAGYSSEDGVIGMVSIGDTNFRGTGDAISLTYETSGDDTDAHGYTFSYRRPWLDSKETVGTFRIYNRTYEYDDYDTSGDLKETYMRKYSGGEIVFGRPVSEYSTNYVTLRNRKDSYVRHVDDGNMGDRSTDAYKQWRDDNFGTTRSVTFEHVTDTRDNVYNPMSGSRLSLSGEFAGFGGDFDFQKYTVDGQRYIRAGRSQVWALRARYGIGNGDISEFNQYRIGGQGSLRGYREDQFRGDREFLGTLEYRFPIIKKVQGALFTDWGGAWDSGLTPDNMHGSVGVGIALTTPIGPLRFDYGWGDDGGRVHFSVGSTF